MIAEITGVVFVSMLFWFVYDYLNHRDRPPGPMRFPILGNLIQVALADPISNIALHKMSKLYGDLVTLKMGMVDVVLISSHKIYVDLYSRNETLDRPAEGFLKDRILGQNLGIVFSKQKEWEIIRRFSAKSLHKFGFANRNSMEKIIHEELETLSEFMENDIRTNPKGLIHFDNYFVMSLINLMNRLALGMRCNYDDKELKSVLDSNVKFNSAGIFGTGLMTAYPFLRHIFPKALGYHIMMESITEIHNFARKHLERQLNLEDGAETNSECYLADFVKKMKEEKNNPDTIFTKDQFVICFTDLLQGTTDTTGGYLDYAILLLTTHPEVQAKVYQEILDVIGKQTRPTMADYMRMDYTRAVIMEIHRFAKILTNFIPRIVAEDITYGNYKIKKGAMLLANQYTMYGDYNSEGKETFRPQRFLSEEGEFLSSVVDNFAPFGAGKRNCFGESLAVDSIFLYLTTLVQKFSFKIPEGEEVPNLSPVMGFTAHPHSFNAKVESRF